MDATRLPWLAAILVVGMSLCLGGSAAVTPAGPPAVPARSSQVSSPTTPAAVASPIPTSRPAPAIAPGALIRALRSVDASTSVGAMVVDRATGAPVLSVNPDRRFRSASLVKLLITIDVLARDPGRPVRNRLYTMLSASDDDLASAFWVASGRSAIVNRTTARLGLVATAPPEDPSMWGYTWTTPREVVRIYQYVLTELPAADRDLVVHALASSPRHAADGFDQYFGIPDGMKTKAAVKQGWGNDSSSVFVHSTGLVGRYIVVLLTDHAPGTPFTVAADSVTAGAATLADLV